MISWKVRRMKKERKKWKKEEGEDARMEGEGENTRDACEGKLVCRDCCFLNFKQTYSFVKNFQVLFFKNITS